MIYVIFANADFTETGMTTVEQFVRRKTFSEGHHVVEIFDAEADDDAREHYQAWRASVRPSLAPSVKAELAKERDKVEREIVAYLRACAAAWRDNGALAEIAATSEPVGPAVVLRTIAASIEQGDYREVPVEERTLRPFGPAAPKKP